MNPQRFNRVITLGPGGVERVLIVQHSYLPGHKGGKGWFDAIDAEGNSLWAYDEDIIANLGPLDDRVKPHPRTWDMSDPEDQEIFPQTEQTAKTCIHDNTVWFGNECGLCEGYGTYLWKDA